MGLARRTIAFPFNGTLDHRLKQITRLAEGVPGGRSDQSLPLGDVARERVPEALWKAHMRKLEIPVVNLEVDCADSRNFSEGQLRTRLEAFMELLESRNGLRS